MALAPTPPVLLQEIVLYNLVVEAFDGAEVGADDSELRSGVGGRSAEGEREEEGSGYRVFLFFGCCIVGHGLRMQREFYRERKSMA